VASRWLDRIVPDIDVEGTAGPTEPDGVRVEKDLRDEKVHRARTG